MARPRTPSNILELRGSFKKNPQRRRQDAPGAGPVDFKPPAHLPTDVAPAWRWLCERLPKILISRSDEIGIEAAARLLTEVWSQRRPEPRLYAELRAWLRELGMTVQARTKMPAGEPSVPKSSGARANRFEALKNLEEE
jgi:hypothetical protein